MTGHLYDWINKAEYLIGNNCPYMPGFEFLRLDTVVISGDARKISELVGGRGLLVLFPTKKKEAKSVNENKQNSKVLMRM